MCWCLHSIKVDRRRINKLTRHQHRRTIRYCEGQNVHTSAPGKKWAALPLDESGPLGTKYSRLRQPKRLIAGKAPAAKDFTNQRVRKDRALAETAALLVLSKKVEAIFRRGEDE